MTGIHIVAMALVAAMTAPALPLRQDLAWSELTERLERAALAGSGQELRAVRIDLLRQLVRFAEQAPAQSLLEYAIAYVGYRLANRGDVPEQEQADLVEDAVERLEALVHDDPEYAEAHALLGSLYGLQIGRDASRGVVLGVRASGALDRAEAAAPDNPRVALLQGISAFHKPARFGGGLDRAERLLCSILALVEHDPPRAKAMLERLASLLQSVFDRLDEPLVLLHRELDTIRDYLQIEQVRFEDRLRFTIDADGEAEQVTVPPFLLQPLVENAVKHGIQPHARQGEVRVTAHRQGARVRVAVTDTGSGPNASQSTGGRGIDLTQRRLRATYGDDGALLSMARAEGGGFTVSLDLPVEPEEPVGSSSAGVNGS